MYDRLLAAVDDSEVSPRVIAAAKWSCPLVRRGSGPGGGVVEVETAGGVEGVLAGPSGQAGEQNRFVVVVAGAVDREQPARQDAGRLRQPPCVWLAS